MRAWQPDGHGRAVPKRVVWSPRRMLAVVVPALLLAVLAGCTNYSAEDPVVNPPIFLGITSPQDSTLAIEAEGTGHILRVRVLNQEVGFQGYRLYTAGTEAALRALATDNGTDCSGLATPPIAVAEYILEAKPGQTAVTPGATGNRLCAFNITLVSSNWVLLRSLIFQSPVSVGTSEPSNAVVVP